MTAREIYVAAIAKFGPEAQTRKSIEELTELSLALLRALDGRADMSNICEEIADCRIMLDQLAIMYDFDDEIAKVQKMKTIRLELLAKKE